MSLITDLNSGGNGRPYFDFRPWITSPVATNLALDSAYTYNSGGDCTAMAYVANETGNLTDIWFKVISFNGTWSSTDQNINLSVREDQSTSNKPGTTLLGDETITLNSAVTGWVKHTLVTPIELAVNKLYYIILADADGGVTNYVTIGRSFTNVSINPVTSQVSSPDGFITPSSSGAPYYIIKHAGVIRATSAILDTGATTTSGTYARGHRFRLPFDVTLVGAVSNTNSEGFLNSGYTCKLFADTTAPGGTPLMSYNPTVVTTGGTAPAVQGVVFPQASCVALSKNTWYRFVVTRAASGTLPRKNYSTATDTELITSALPLGGDFYYTQDTGGSWVDSTDALCQIFPLFAPSYSSSGSGGSYAFVG